MRGLGLVSLMVILCAAGFPAAAKLAIKPLTPKQQFEELADKAKTGDSQAQYDLGLAYRDGRFDQKPDDEKAAEWIEKAAESGSAGAQYDIAEMYRTGRGVKADSQQALIWYVKAADQGRAEAMLRVCTAYTQDDKIPVDWPRAFKYCKPAAAAGGVNAQYALGLAYADGLGTAPDTALAMQNLKMAADQGHAGALKELGQIYMMGDLAPQNYAESLNLFKKAARRGDRDAIRLMAHQYADGLGTPADLGRAARLYRILARDDDAPARDWLKAHPDAPADQEILDLEKLPRDVIFYATETNDPRFQTLDIHGYFDQLSVSAYPADAQNDGVSGEATAECRFMPSGDFDDCVLTKENPKNYGFGASLMRIMDRLGSSGNKTDWARRFDSKVLRVSMKWKIK